MSMEPHNSANAIETRRLANEESSVPNSSSGMKADSAPGDREEFRS